MNKGHDVSYDWTAQPNLKPYSQNPLAVSDFCEKDLDGVLECDVFIQITGSEKSERMGAELGAALGGKLTFDKPKIYIVGPNFDNNPMYFHPAVERRDTIEEVIEEI